jgi:acetyl-CoA synthetase
MEKTKEILFRPSPELIKRSYVSTLMKTLGATNLESLRKVSTLDISKFWDTVVADTEIEWFHRYTKTLDTSDGIEWARWFIDGKINIAYNCIDRHAGKTQTALIWEGDDGQTRQLSYQALAVAVNRAANLLKSLDVGVGDTVGLLMPMVPEVVIQLFACLKIGAVAIPIFSGFGAEAVGKRLDSAKAKVLFTADVSFRRGKTISVKSIADEACKLSPSIRHRIVLIRTTQKCPWDPSFDIPWSALEKQPDTCSTAELDSEATSLILFTSGTTGQPKGTIHTHAGALATIAKELRYAFNCDSSSRFFWFTDIGWMMGPWEMIGVTHFGGTLFLFEGAPDYPQPDRVWDMVERHQITTLGISPTAIRLLIRYGNLWADKHSMKSLTLLGSTGEPWDPESYLWYFEKVGKKRCPVINISGGTEIIGCLLSPLPIQPLKACSLGGPGLGVDADVFDESGSSIRGGIGHLVCKQPLPSMTKGFLNARERYLETYFSKFSGVWYHGDWAQVDEDGQWFLHGRSDDTIKIAGKRVGPVEYEAALMSDTRVAEAAAVGVPDPVKGESCVCFVVLKPGHEFSDELRAELLIKAQNTLGKSLAPKAILFCASLPKTRSAKILRGLIRSIHLKKEVSDLSSVENPESIEAIRSAV